MTFIAGRQDREELAVNRSSLSSDVPELLEFAVGGPRRACPLERGVAQ